GGITLECPYRGTVWCGAVPLVRLPRYHPSTAHEDAMDYGYRRSLVSRLVDAATYLIRAIAAGDSAGDLEPPDTPQHHANPRDRALGDRPQSAQSRASGEREN